MAVVVSPGWKVLSAGLVLLDIASVAWQNVFWSMHWIFLWITLIHFVFGSCINSALIFCDAIAQVMPCHCKMLLSVDNVFMFLEAMQNVWGDVDNSLPQCWLSICRLRICWWCCHCCHCLCCWGFFEWPLVVMSFVWLLIFFFLGALV